jgi:hypothetical protein
VDSHGQRHSGLDLRHSLLSQVAILPDLALQAGVVGSSPIISTTTGPGRLQPIVHFVSV